MCIRDRYQRRVHGLRVNKEKLAVGLQVANLSAFKASVVSGNVCKIAFILKLHLKLLMQKYFRVYLNLSNEAVLGEVRAGDRYILFTPLLEDTAVFFDILNNKS
eukprot:TRINITY_DN2761_c0_g2_i1.p1 TRINITY_DN2761_c0_g2~~TRINITY_DN2761_c0_g2_i1.p1  ORF type:complete len:104 (-),score=11.85 TRINITY_DN2761_c0_g2_i1:86-397(-)